MIHNVYDSFYVSKEGILMLGNQLHELKSGLNIIDELPWDLRSEVWSRTAGSLASDGVYMKTELPIEGINYYLKLSRYDSYRGIYGHESVNELIASRLGKLLGFDVPEGFLKKCLVKIDDKEHDTYVFAAKSYKTNGSRVAFEDFYIDNRLSDKESPLELCKRFGWTDTIYKMFIFDYLIINRDRHGANLEVMKNGDIILSPFLDNGLSFVCSCVKESELTSFDIMEDRAVNNFIGDKRLEANLKRIDKKIEFTEIKEEDLSEILTGLQTVLPESYLNIIHEIIWRRWQNVIQFRIV